MDETFKLSASLEGHDDDVRGVAFPNPSLVISASRDASVRLWRLEAPTPPRYDGTISSHGSSFINSVAYIPPNADFAQGLVISGARDGIIEVRQPSSGADDNAEALLLGHSNNVCALDVSPDGTTIVSGSWDTDARVWHVGKWETSVVLEGHQASVLTVLAYNSDLIITGCADKLIRLYHPSGKQLRSIQASSDVVRALCRLPSSHPSGAQFASAGNDAIIRLWTLAGQQAGEMHGHENFIYSLAAVSTGELVSSSEDRTVRIWSGNQCIQTITHPAISVWSVAVCKDNGDIVTGASDKIVRVFSRSPERVAEPATLKAFEESVQTSSIPQQPLGDINKTDLPGPDFLKQKSGTKEGQVQLIKERNGNVSAYQWSSGADQWVSVGTVVDAAGNASKVSYNGKDYDYVFDVDIEEGKPALKLPYNASQNPYEVAQKFILHNELPLSYIDQVANFIIQNSQGTVLGGQNPNQASESAPGSDPWGTESRYRPNDAQQAQTTEPATQKTLPQRNYLAISTGNHKMILKKIDEFNQQLFAEGRKDLTLNADDMKILSQTMTLLEPLAGKQDATLQVAPQSVNAAIRGATEWPPDKRLPWLDFLRLLTAASTSAITQISNGTDQTLITRLAASEVFSSSAPVNNTMLATRTLANLFCSGPGRTLADLAFDQILGLVAPHASTQNKNLIIALTTLYINFAVLLTSSSAPGKDGVVEHEQLNSSDTAASADRAITLLDTLTTILNSTSEPEALYRALVAAGTVLALGKDFADVAKEGLGIEEAITRAEKVGKEPRIKNVVREIRNAIGS